MYASAQVKEHSQGAEVGYLHIPLEDIYNLSEFGKTSQFQGAAMCSAETESESACRNKERMQR